MYKRPFINYIKRHFCKSTLFYDVLPRCSLAAQSGKPIVHQYGVTSCIYKRGYWQRRIVMSLPSIQSLLALPDDRRKYKCTFPDCYKSFTTSGHLARHNRIHTGEKNFACLLPGCPSRFSRQDNMMQHYRTHLNTKKKRSRSPTHSPPQHTFTYPPYVVLSAMPRIAAINATISTRSPSKAPIVLPPPYWIPPDAPPLYYPPMVFPSFPEAFAPPAMRVDSNLPPKQEKTEEAI